MKKIAEIQNTGLVLFVDETRKGGTTSGTQEDCLQYAYTHNDGDCYAFMLSNDRPVHNSSVGNVQSSHNFISGIRNTNNGGGFNIINGSNNLTSRRAGHSIVNGRNAYSENYGENVYSPQVEANRSRHITLGYAGRTTDDSKTILYIGNNRSSQFYVNSDYATAYFIEWQAVGLNASSGEMWSATGYYAFRNIGELVSVGNPKPVVFRDSNLDYDFDISEATISDGDNFLAVAVTGETNHEVYWNVTLEITEIRTPEIASANTIANSNFLGSPNWNKINQDANNVITVPNDATLGGAKMVGNGGRNLALRFNNTWGTAKWKITFDLDEVTGQALVVQVRVNNQNSQVFNRVGTHTYYVDTNSGANFIQFMVNSTTGAGACIINNVKCQTITY